MKKVFSLALVFISLALGLSATNVVDLTPGTLKTALGADAATVTSLSLSGSIDASDLYFLGDNCEALTTLDLSQVTIEPYSGVTLKGLTQYPAATIPANAFAGSALRSIVFPAGQPDIAVGSGAFAGSQLTSLTLPANVTAVGAGAFASCHSLANVTIANPVCDEGVFTDCTSLATVTLNGTQATGRTMFDHCTALTTVNGSETLKSIASGSFSNCSSLASFTFGAPLQEIGDDAFAYSSLQTADLTACEALKSVGDWAFAHNQQLGGALLPQSVETIGQGAFFQCEALVDYATPASVTALSNYLLTGDNAVATSSLIPAGVETIGDYALANLTHVTTLTLPSTLTYIGDGAMQNLTSLQSIQAGTLVDVPELGDQVWQGVNQELVNLFVPKESLEDYKAAAQWQDFDIMQTSSVIEINPDAATETHTCVQARFIGSLLQVRAAGDAVLTGVTLYDLNGRMLLHSDVNSQLVQIDTAPHQGNYFVVYVTLANNTDTAIKLARTR